MPYPGFIKVIIQYFILKHKSISKINELFMNSIKHDGVLGRLKFVGKHEDNQVYEIDTPNVSMKKTSAKPQKLKGIKTLSEAAQFAADTQKAIKVSKKAHILQQKTEDSSEGAGITLEVPDELKGRTKSSIERAVISPENDQPWIGGVGSGVVSVGVGVGVVVICEGISDTNTSKLQASLSESLRSELLLDLLLQFDQFQLADHHVSPLMSS
nr:hypothetical protein [Tanacetum cinerariifolium]